MAKGYAMRLDEQTVSDRIRKKTNGLLEYISGYTIKEKPVRVRCTVCGGEFERTYHNITTKGGVTCPYCVKSERSKRKETERAQRAAEAEKKARAASARKQREAKQVRIAICGCCGEPFYTWSSRRVFCSKECARHSHMKTQGSDDRLSQANVVDRDITLEKLYERDGGVCQICGRMCDYSDYRINENGVHIAGNLYPSRDHIIPLKNGGKHSWDNVRLAHRICNSKLYWEKQRFTSPGV